ncbi:MAG: T9SS type A sorting domain-containing protein [Bacteroidetes bacterium]|nr:T9SS type A sorting domain-containing protein [Bacteroidota bacterium]
MKKLSAILIFLALSCQTMFGQTPIAPAVGDGSSGNPYQIASLENLYWIAYQVDIGTPSCFSGKYFVQTADIDASATSTWFSYGLDDYYGWDPAGTSDYAKTFAGSYDGQGHTISGLYINRPDEFYVGLFAVIDGGNISNLGMTNVNITGGYCGSIVSIARFSTVLSNCFTTGTVFGVSGITGGLIGMSDATCNIYTCYNACDVYGTDDYIGGIVGYADKCDITNCFNTGTVTGPNYVGGITGNASGTIENCYNAGVISGTGDYIGGIIGGDDYGTCVFVNNFWDTETSGTTDGNGWVSPDPSGITGKTTSEMQTKSTFTDASWDFITNWAVSSDNYPFFKWQMKAIVWNGSWSPFAPTYMDDVSMTANYNDVGFTCHNLTVDPGKQLTVTSGTLDIGDSLIFKSNTSKVIGSFINHGTLSVGGTIQYERYVPQDVYEYISSPLATQTTSAFGTISGTAGAGKRLFTFNNSSNAWDAVSNGAGLATMQGYSFKSFGTPATVVFSGKSLNTGNKSFLLAKNTTGFNLVGNPYTSSIDWTTSANSYWTRANVQPTIWINYANALGAANFATYNYSSTFATNWAGNVGTNEGIIPPTQAFWVETTTNETSLTVMEGAQMHSVNAVNKSDAAITSPFLRLKTERDTYSDEAVLFFNENATAGYDEYDTRKQLGGGVYPQLYSSDADIDMAVNSIPLSMLNNSISIPLIFRSDMAGSCSITATDIANFDATIKIYLEDTQLSQTINLNETSTYSFNVAESTVAPDRFIIHFVRNTTGLETIDNQGISVYSSYKNIYINNPKNNYSVEVINALGEKIISKKVPVKGITTINTDMPKGIYFVLIKSDSEVFAKKIFIE